MDNQLASKGWHLSAAGLKECQETAGKGNITANDIIKVALKYDLRQIAQRILPDNISSGQIESIDGPIVLQVQKVRNISAPLANPDSKSAPRMLKFNLTDGCTHCSAVEFDSVSFLNTDIVPGTKLCLNGVNIPVVKGVILLDDRNVKVLGGDVEKLKTKWEANKQATALKRSGKLNDDPPPPFKEFDGTRPLSKSSRNTQQQSRVQASKESDDRKRSNDTKTLTSGNKNSHKDVGKFSQNSVNEYKQKDHCPKLSAVTTNTTGSKTNDFISNSSNNSTSSQRIEAFNKNNIANSNLSTKDIKKEFQRNKFEKDDDRTLESKKPDYPASYAKNNYDDGRGRHDKVKKDEYMGHGDGGRTRKFGSPHNNRDVARIEYKDKRDVDRERGYRRSGKDFGEMKNEDHSRIDSKKVSDDRKGYVKSNINEYGRKDGKEHSSREKYKEKREVNYEVQGRNVKCTIDDEKESKFQKSSCNKVMEVSKYRIGYDAPHENESSDDKKVKQNSTKARDDKRKTYGMNVQKGEVSHQVRQNDQESKKKEFQLSKSVSHMNDTTNLNDDANRKGSHKEKFERNGYDSKYDSKKKTEPKEFGGRNQYTESKDMEKSNGRSYGKPNDDRKPVAYDALNQNWYYDGEARDDIKRDDVNPSRSNDIQSVSFKECKDVRKDVNEDERFGSNEVRSKKKGNDYSKNNSQYDNDRRKDVNEDERFGGNEVRSKKKGNDYSKNNSQYNNDRRKDVNEKERFRSNEVSGEKRGNDYSKNNSQYDNDRRKDVNEKERFRSNEVSGEKKGNDYSKYSGPYYKERRKDANEDERCGTNEVRSKKKENDYGKNSGQYNNERYKDSPMYSYDRKGNKTNNPIAKDSKHGAKDFQNNRKQHSGDMGGSNSRRNNYDMDNQGRYMNKGSKYEDSSNKRQNNEGNRRSRNHKDDMHREEVHLHGKKESKDLGLGTENSVADESRSMSDVNVMIHEKRDDPVAYKVNENKNTPKYGDYMKENEVKEDVKLTSRELMKRSLERSSQYNHMSPPDYLYMSYTSSQQGYPHQQRLPQFPNTQLLLPNHPINYSGQQSGVSNPYDNHTYQYNEMQMEQQNGQSIGNVPFYPNNAYYYPLTN